jgi:hypothetical protein
LLPPPLISRSLQLAGGYKDKKKEVLLPRPIHAGFTDAAEKIASTDQDINCIIDRKKHAILVRLLQLFRSLAEDGIN